MERYEVDQLIAMHANKIPFEAVGMVRQKLTTMNSSGAMFMGHMKDPTIALILSILLGQLGIDRFYIGDFGIGVLKLLSCGGFGLWWIIDLFLIMDSCRRKNLEMLLRV